MKIFADEGIERRVVTKLRQSGFEVFHVAESLKALPDTDVLDLSLSSGAVLLTQDKDFGHLVFREGRASFGVLLLRLGNLSALEKARVVRQTLLEHGADLPGAFSVLSEHLLRIRRL